MKSKDFFALQDAYKVMYAEAKDESPEKEEEDRKKDDDLFGSPNKKKNGKKADKDYDGDGKVESSKDEYFGSKDKAIKKAMGKDVKEARWWDVDVNEAVYGGKKEEKKDTEYVHRGMAQRSFNREWQLTEDVEITKVTFEDGLLTVDLGKIVPEHHARKDYL